MAMGYASAPSRGTGKLTIQFGLVSVPVDVFNGVDEDANKITRHQRAKKSGAAVQYKKVDSSDGEFLNGDEIKFVVVQEDGEEIDLTDEEIDKAMALTNGTCELVGFFDVDKLHSYETKALFQVRPQSVKVGKKTTHPHVKAFQLLMDGMQKTGSFALLTYVMRGKMHLAGLTADGLMRDFYWTNEVREELPVPTVEVSEKESAMALMLIDAMRRDDLPALENDAVKAVRAYVEDKAKGTVSEPAEAKDAPVELDLEALLQASLSSHTKSVMAVGK